MLLALLSACAGTGGDDTGVLESPLAGAWAGALAAEWTFADGVTATLSADAALRLESDAEETDGYVRLWGTSTGADGEAHAAAGLVPVDLETPMFAREGDLVRAYLDDPCAYVHVADRAHVVCPFATTDTWRWDGADAITHRHEAPEGVATLTLRRQP